MREPHGATIEKTYIINCFCANFSGCGTDGRLLVSQEDFLHAVSDLVPSVSAEELQYYATLQQTLGTQKQTGALS